VVTVALTGGIGSGKSTVAALLVDMGAMLIDADVIAREVVEPGQPDRPALAAVAFADDAARADLDGITHPAINEEFVRRMQEAPKNAVVVCDVPLLAESVQAQARAYRFVIVVEAPDAVRLARLEQRGVSRADAERRIAAQATDEQRRALATHVIDNSGDLAALERQVEAVYADLLRHRADPG